MKLSTKLLAGVILLSFVALFFAPKFAKDRLKRTYGPPVSEELHSYELSTKNFDRIRILGAWQVKIEQASEFSVIFKAPKKEYASVGESVLTLNAPFWPSKQNKVYEAIIRMPLIDRIEFATPEAVTGKGGITIRYEAPYNDSASRQNVILTGFNSESLLVETGTGFGRIKAENCTIGSLVLRCYGNTKADFRSCPAKNVDVETASDAEVHALVHGGTLNASINGGSTFYYYGNAAKEKIKIAHPAKVVNVKQ